MKITIPIQLMEGEHLECGKCKNTFTFPSYMQITLIDKDEYGSVHCDGCYGILYDEELI